MGLLIVGLAFLAGLGIAQALSEKASAPAAPPAPRPAAARVGYAQAVPQEPLKAQPGDLVASFPHGRWGEVLEVQSGADGCRYVVGFQNGAAVELRGAEITR